MKKQIMIVLLLVATFLNAAEKKKDMSGLEQTYGILNKLKEAAVEIPPDIERVAVYRIRVDHEHFEPGMSRYIRERLEDTFRETTRIEVVTAPELKTIRVDITDISFSFKNTIPTLEELWDLGKKLRVDAFIDGSVTMTELGDMLVTLKLVKNKTGEIVWSESLIAGPNEKKEYKNPLRFQLATGVHIVSLEESGYLDSVTDVKTLDADATLYLYNFGMQLRQALMPSSQLFFQIRLDGSVGTFSTESGSMIRSALGFGGDFGISAILKKRERDSYMLDIMFGVQGEKYFTFQGAILSFLHGYNFNVTDNFTLNASIRLAPFETTLFASNNNFMTTELMGYNFGIIYNF